LQSLIAKKGQRLLRPARESVARLPSGAVDLILTSPPYGCEGGGVNK
jgi:hypothetical protein